MTYALLDLFAGPGGWDEGAKSLGITTYGVEIDADACATARAAGHPRLQADVLDVAPWMASGWERDIFVASPPCVAFSRLNKGHSRKHVDELVDAVLRGDWTWAQGELKPEVLLPLVMGPWIAECAPRAIAFEQVPSVLPVWRAYAEWLHVRMGYTVWAGILDAADYGVPQHRKRAVLMAVRGREALMPPSPTHGPKGEHPYVNAGDALKWTSTTVRDPDRVNDQSGTPFDPDWPFKRPALTIAGRPLMNHPGANANRFNGRTKSRNDGFIITEQEMAVLQGFREDYPFVGKVTSIRKQIGNVVPPPLARAILEVLL